jgi:hypothetical protein
MQNNPSYMPGSSSLRVPFQADAINRVPTSQICFTQDDIDPQQRDSGEKILLVEHPCSIDGTWEQVSSNAAPIFVPVVYFSYEVRCKKICEGCNTLLCTYFNRLFRMYDTMVEVYTEQREVSQTSGTGLTEIYASI